MQSLGRSLRQELGDFKIPVCLAAPLGSGEPLPSAEASTVPPQEAPRGLIGMLTGLGRARPSLLAYARHVVSGMLVGAPYILAPGGDGVMPHQMNSASSPGMLGGVFGYDNLTPAVLVLQALTMPMLTLLDVGLPITWREVVTRWTVEREKPGDKGSSPYNLLKDDPMAA